MARQKREAEAGLDREADGRNRDHRTMSRALPPNLDVREVRS